MDITVSSESFLVRLFENLVFLVFPETITNLLVWDLPEPLLTTHTHSRSFTEGSKTEETPNVVDDLLHLPDKVTSADHFYHRFVREFTVMSV